MSKPIKILKQKAGYSDKDIAEKFVIEETDGEWVVKALDYLDGKTFNILVREFGAYEKDQKTKTAIFHLAKQPSSHEMDSEVVYKESRNEIQTTPLEEGEYALSKSLKGKLKQLVPCLEDAEGIMFDGFHRKKINPDAWTVKLDHVKTSVDRALARMTVNFCRRHYTSEEMKNDIGLLVGSGYKPEQIQEITGISLSTIYKYMPQEMKDKTKVEAGRLGGISAPSSEQTVKTQETKDKALSEAQKKGWEEKKEFPSSETPLKTQETIPPQEIYQKYMLGLRECEKCGTKEERDKMSFIDNLLVCRKCAGKTAGPTIQKPEPPQKPYKEKADFRVAQMHPQKSKFELAVIQELQAEGLPLETDQEFCVQKTVPDAILKLKDRTVVIYIDNVATHEEGNERDEFLRSSLKKLYDFDVCVVQYKNDSVEERQRAKETIKEFLKW